MENWKATNIENAKYLGVIEIEGKDGFETFEVVETETRLVFGGSANNGFLESGYIEKDGFSTDETLQELVSDLETYYTDGEQYVSRIVCNERM